jgi:hypothetical protein
MVATNDVRHRLTDYDQLLRVRGLTREEARLIVASEVKQIVALWAAPALRFRLSGREPV